MRDTAVNGLLRLFARPEWRTSAHGPQITERMANALKDESSLVRMLAAPAAGSLEAGATPAERARTVGALLRQESVPSVQEALLATLSHHASTAPFDVDSILDQYMTSLHRHPDGTDDERQEHLVGLLTFLGVIHHTPFASGCLTSWTSSAPTLASEVQVMAQGMRDYINPRADSAVQHAAFQLLATSVETSLERWNRNPEERQSDAELSDQDRSELEGALQVTATIAEQIYFASGAFNHDQTRALGPDHVEFAECAFPLLLACASIRFAPCTHQVVDTLVFLAPLEEKKTLIAIADAVVGDTTYTRDPLASAQVIPYLTRLLAEQRPLVLYDNDGATAFRQLLAAFAAVGNEAALEMIFTLADLFR